MPFKSLTPSLSVSPQLSEADVAQAARDGFRAIIDNRPDGEEPGQLSAADMQAFAAGHGMGFAHVPAIAGKIGDAEVARMADALARLDGPVLAYCRTGTRSTTLWALSQAGARPADSIIATAADAGYDLSALRPRLETRETPPRGRTSRTRRHRHRRRRIGGPRHGSIPAWSATAHSTSSSSNRARRTTISQAGRWSAAACSTWATRARAEASVIPAGVRWIKGAVASFEPERDHVTLEDGEHDRLPRAGRRAGHRARLGRDRRPAPKRLAGTVSPRTTATIRRPILGSWSRALKGGTALFTQPPMPIKCAGAPQKAMYLSCDYWRRSDVLEDIDVEFHKAGAVLFGVKEFVPPLMEYVGRYGIDLQFESTLIAVNGSDRTATFREKGGEVTKAFDMIHVTPPQKAPAFLARSPLANEAGYADVDQGSLQHVRHANVFGLGDGGSTPNAKTMAAARKQAPVVAENLLAVLAGKPPTAIYDGYGSCPLTVERGKILLAEFGYGGKLLPSFPSWIIEGTKPQRLSWLLKSEALPWIYWNAMLKGREWMAHPQHRDVA